MFFFFLPPFHSIPFHSIPFRSNALALRLILFLYYTSWYCTGIVFHPCGNVAGDPSGATVTT